MPFIDVKASVKIDDAKADLLKAELGKAICTLPGKSEAWLMVGVEGDKKLYFKGDGSQPLAFITVSILGKSERKYFEKMTSELCRIMESVIGVPPGGVYVKYEECEHWGWNGQNF